MSFIIGLAQCGYPGDDGVVDTVRLYAAEAKKHGCSLLVFPEDLMSPRPLSRSELIDQAEPLDGPFVRTLGDIAREQGLWIVGTTSEAAPDGLPPYNTAIVLDDAGNLRLSYRKCHLYDAHGVRESDRMTAGNTLGAVVETPFCKLGVCICYDLRFPESARALALAGCDVAVYPACWYDGYQKAEHWQTLLRARAIENECFVVGACRAGTKYVGKSMVANPLGQVLACGPTGEEEALVVCKINTDEVARARDAMPVLDHRRPELYEP